MALETILPYFFWRGSGNYFDTPWIWYLGGQGSRIWTMDGVIFLLLGILIFFWYYYYPKIEKKISSLALVSILLIAVFVKPVGSADLSCYFSAAKAAFQGQNIYISKWKRVYFGDPKIVYIDSELYGFTYGPLSLKIFKNIYNISRDNVILFSFIIKLLNIIALFACAFIIFQLLKLFTVPLGWQNILFIFVLQPLIIFETMVNGHFDVWWIALFIAAIYYAKKNKWFLVLPLLALSIWLKYIPIIVLPVFIVWFMNRVSRIGYRVAFRDVFIGLISSVIITYVSWHGYWSGSRVFDGILGLSQNSYLTVYHLLDMAILPLFKYFVSLRATPLFGAFVGALMFVVTLFFAWPFIIMFIKKLIFNLYLDDKYFIKVIFLTIFLCFLFLTKYFWPWYFIWPLICGQIYFYLGKNEYLGKILHYLSAAPIIFYLFSYLYCKIFDIRHFESLFFLVAVICAILFVYPVYYLYRWRKIKYE